MIGLSGISSLNRLFHVFLVFAAHSLTLYCYYRWSKTECCAGSTIKKRPGGGTGVFKCVRFTTVQRQPLFRGLGDMFPATLPTRGMPPHTGESPNQLPIASSPFGVRIALALPWGQSVLSKTQSVTAPLRLSLAVNQIGRAHV